MQEKNTRSVRLDSLETRRLLAATKVMPLGDSITEGWPDAQSYRYNLYQLLAQGGYSVDFVGSQAGNYNKNSVLNNLDQNNEGHSGYRADQLRDNIVSWANAAKPDVVLLHAGTNDLLQSQDNTGTTGEIGQIIDNLRAVVPNVKILLAKVIPGVTYPSAYPDLNNKIAALAASKSTAASPISVVDQYSGFDANADTSDGIHPNLSGEMKMAQKWYAALTSVLPAPTPPPAGTYLDGLTPTSATNGSGPFEQDRSNGGTGAIDGKTLTLNGATYMRGLGVAASSALVYDISGKGYTQFNADIGVDDEITSGGGIKFQVFADNVLKYDSGTMTATTATKSITVDITGAAALKLVVLDAGGGSAAVDHGDWANARVVAAAVVAPAAPSNLAASVNGSNIVLNWSDNSTNETNFRIERKVSGGTYATLIDVPANQTTYTDLNATAGTAYTYRVFAYNTGGSSGTSNESSATVPVVTGSAYLSDLSYVVVSNGWGPVEKNKSNGEQGANDGKTLTLNGTTYAKGLGVHAASEITLSLAGKYSSFTSSIGVDDEVGSAGSVVFQIYVDNVKQYDSGVMTGSTATKTPTVSLSGAQTLRLVVTTNNDPNSDHADWANAYLSTATAALPAAPSNLTAVYTSVNASGVQINWTDNSNNETGFKIQRKIGAAGTWTDYITTTANITSYLDTAVAASTTYAYRVYAYNGAGNSATSNEPSVTTPTPATIPAAPSNATATLAPAGNAVVVGWTDNSADETGFVLQRKVGNGPWSTLVTTAANVTSYTDSSVLAGQTYSYRVAATNTAGTSATSNEPSITTPATPATTTVYASDLPYEVGQNGWGNVEKDKSNGESASGDGRAITLNGKTYAKGFGTHASSDIYIHLDGNYSGFTADVGMDDEVGDNGTVVFEVWADGVKLYDSGTMTGASATRSVNVDLTGRQLLLLAVKDAGDGNAFDHADWADAKLSIATAPSVPAAASGATATYNSAAGNVAISWTDNAGNETGFRIERKVDGGSYAVVGTAAANATSFTDTTGTPPGSTYTYRVIAYNATGDAAASNESSVMVAAPTVPAAPSGLTAAYSAATKKVTLAWTDASSNETGFRVERQTGGGAWTTVATTSANVATATDSGPFTASTTYGYRVIAVNAVGDSTASNTAPLTTPSGSVLVSDLTPTSATNGWGAFEKDKSNGEEAAGDGRTISLRGKTYAKGLGTHGYSKIVYNLAGAYSLFTSDLGIDDETGGNGSVVFTVYVDGVAKYTSGVTNGKDAVKTASVNVAGAQQLWLVVDNANDGADFDHADWADAQLTA